jgi:hypothetical protein
LNPHVKKKKVKKIYSEKKPKIIAVRRGYQSLEQLRTELNSSERTRTVLSMVLTSRGPITNYPGA